MYNYIDDNMLGLLVIDCVKNDMMELFSSVGFFCFDLSMESYFKLTLQSCKGGMFVYDFLLCEVEFSICYKHADFLCHWCIYCQRQFTAMKRCLFFKKNALSQTYIVVYHVPVLIGVVCLI